MSTEAGIKRSRVILGATCYADAEAALSVAVTIAKQIDAELHGLLVSDDAILTAVEGPQTLTISYSGSRIAIENADTMREAYRADAAHFRRRLLELADQASLGHAFSQASGRMPRAAAELAGQGDLIVYGFRRPHGAEEGVVLIVDGAGDTAPFEIANRLAQALDQPLIVIASPGERDTVREAMRSAGIKQAQLRRMGDARSLLAELGGMRPAAVLLADAGRQPGEIERLVEAARCPVIVPAR